MSEVENLLKRSAAIRQQMAGLLDELENLDRDARALMESGEPKILKASPRMPFLGAWREIDADQLGWMGKLEGRCGRVDKVEFDGVPCLRHRVAQGQEVHDEHMNMPVIPVDLSSAQAVCLTYWQFRMAYHSQSGKDIAASIGHGYYGSGKTIGQPDLTGDSGCTANVMHPSRGETNGIRLFATWDGMGHKYGYVVDAPDGQALHIPLLGVWQCVQVVGWLDRGWQLYHDRLLVAEDMTRGPICAGEEATSVGGRGRFQYGGKPQLLPAKWPLEEYFSNFWWHVL